LKREWHYEIIYKAEEFPTGDPDNPFFLDTLETKDQIFIELLDYYDRRDN